MSEDTETYSIIEYPGESLPEAYQGLVRAKWLHSLRYGTEFFKKMAPSSYYAEYGYVIHKTLLNPECRVKLAVLSDDHDVVLGFLVYRDDKLDYVYVHKDNRRIGIATSMLPKGITQISNLTRTAVTIWEKKYGYWVFNPFK